MSERRRALPSWMAKKEEKVKEKEPLRSTKKRKTARAAFYCMNERELVEAAESCLTDAVREDVSLPSVQKVKDKSVETAVKMKGDFDTSKTISKTVTLEESSECSDALETTYVSETDLDITEVETVPYTDKSPQHQGAEGQRSGPVQDRGGLLNVGPEAEETEERSQMPAEAAEDDALRLVREIFFS